MLNRRSLIAGLGLAGVCAPAVLRAQAAEASQAWPSQVVKIVVPFTPGGSTDVLARLIAAKIAPTIGGPGFIIENKAGAGGTIAAAQVAKAAPDGHTLMMGHIGTLAFNPALYPDLPYDPIRDFEPVALVASVPNILVVNPEVPAKDFQEFVAYAKANPGKLNYSSGGQGSAAHIAGAYLAYKAGFQAVHVPYRGTAPSVVDLIGGVVQFTLTGGPAVLPFASKGQLRALGVASAERATFAPQLPTIAESGLPGFEAVQWYGIVAPKGTPREIVDRLNREINAQLATPEFAAVLEKDGAVATPRPPEAFGELIASELPVWREVITQAQIKAGG
ncbi:Bug family tripartite tricarboxylate transporter substrate binding protein [Ancylobacter defluvii]|uniref:MFS transporter n=1 Tax=Ancylobacter defluvii TaxID=1282440 RepID=A0A9W6K0A2_9HYPH|nr:tripartite tricarboxylate transporter substrate binding protein [Ancylobacter defluvii]MBS7586353.1 tripartite tricarboxylate transporter substrate binding protein [Ancylobacter defluvii]GLK85634.1 MFS transporter [Ancylobacter defluvii]